jgi:VWFA-related protein
VTRVRPSRLVLVCLLVMSATASDRVLTQSQPPSQSQSQTQSPPQSQPTFRVGATFVRVDAYVTKDGKPVTDLTADDFDVFEDGARQTIRSFELVNIPPAFAQTTPRQDPQSAGEMREKVADPRRRVIVLFIDTYHSAIGSSMSSRKAFLRFLQRLVGPDDLIAGMTPEMSPEALAFGSRTDSLEEFLNGLWGRRDAIQQDPDEDFMELCFWTQTDRDLWQMFRDRRRTKKTLDALEGLVRAVGGMREERKAIITVTEGWELFSEYQKLIETTDGTRPLHTGPAIVRTPQGFGTNDSRQGGAPNQGECDKIRLELANMETIHQFRDLPALANRNNASFYIIDPRGLPAADELLGPRPPVADQAMLRSKQEGMRELAGRTDGMAFFYSNDLDSELTRIAQDLSSYYLLGYDSTNAKLDGGYRNLSVKVKRPGVLVRARKGYRAATLPAPGASSTRGGGGAGAATNPANNDIASAVGAVMGTRADLPVRLRATAVRLLGTTTSNGPSQPLSELRVIAELDATLAASDAWRQGGTAHFIVKGDGLDTPIAIDAPLQPGARTLTATIPLPSGSATGEYRVQMRVNAQSHTDALSDSTTVQVAAPGLIGSPTILRRGPSTGINYVATADARFRRADRLRLEAPSRLPAAQVKVTAVDQRGQPLNLPIQVSERQEASATILVADISLAPLAPGGYAIVLTSGAERVIVPLQLIP